ncbi:MAG: type V CRISPR-associated endonuclease Cas1 [Synergistes sp.]|nr:type V CRISPR-associated endonuclease Cas1 [Synergistes sp.]
MLTLPDFAEKKIVVVFSMNGEKISFKNDNILVTDSEGKTKMQFTCYRLFAVFIVGGFTLTTGIVERSKKFGFSIVMFTANFKVHSAINFVLEGNTHLRRKQYLCDAETENEIARQIIINKIENQRDMLKKLRNPAFTEGTEKLDEIINLLSAAHNISGQEIMGYEGTASKVYFTRMFFGFDWHGRRPRVKQDEINLLMDIGYTVLFNYIEAVLNIFGFDVYKGNLHKEFYKRKSLVCDIIEPFRPIIDYKIRKAINLGQTRSYDYFLDNRQFRIGWKDSSRFVLLILEEIIRHRIGIYKYVQQYYRWFMKAKSVPLFPKASIEEDDNCKL